jgi:hypothetical protein
VIEKYKRPVKSFLPNAPANKRHFTILLAIELGAGANLPAWPDAPRR